MTRVRIGKYKSYFYFFFSAGDGLAGKAYSLPLIYIPGARFYILMLFCYQQVLDRAWAWG
jgi:hypothetical protein